MGRPDPHGIGPAKVIEDRSVGGDALIRFPEAGGVRAGSFWMTEQREPAGSLRLTLAGELDIASAGALRDRLLALCAAGDAVVLDLSGLEFIDSSGVRELVRAMSRASRDGWALSLDPTTGPQVGRVIDLLGLSDLFWPAA